MREFYRQLLDTADSAGLQIISDDNCCKLLAWLYAYGGSVEAVIYNIRMNENIKYAQRKLNITGGEVPNEELLPLLKKYLDEVKTGTPAWAYDICREYNISVKVINQQN
jgi:hypothetical protein